MASLLTATMGAKGQVTLPKVVRELLGLHQSGELIGFLVEEEKRLVRLSRLKVVPDDEEFSEEEYRKLLGLPEKKGGKAFSSMKSLLQDLKRS